MISIEEMAVFCKKKGIVFPNSEIYNGLSGFFDFGPLGVELKNNIKTHWWHTFVKSRQDIVGLDGAIISHPKVWQASGHVANFADVMAECKKCHQRIRADHLVEDVLKISTQGLHAKELNDLIQKHKIHCPHCKGELAEASPFNLMFSTHVGPKQDQENIAYLRPETAQLIFANFKNVVDTGRVKLPFGIAQIGKAFRNEISPRDFLFRCREFEQMEIEFFINPKQTDCPLLTKELLATQIQLLDAKGQQGEEENMKKSTFGDLLKEKKLNPFHVYWLAQAYQWYLSLGISPEHLRVREHVSDELSHYSSATYDVDYLFPTGWKEIHGCANRGNYDLTQHEKVSTKQLRYYDEESKEKILPHVIEPSWGVERAMLALLFEAHADDKERGNVVLRLHPQLAPIQVGVFPLVKNKEEIADKAKEIYEKLRHPFTCTHDESGSVGRRYARADEQGVPFCITVDFESLEDNKVTVRDRDTTKQDRVPITELAAYLHSKINK